MCPTAQEPWAESETKQEDMKEETGLSTSNPNLESENKDSLSSTFLLSVLF